MKTITDWIGAHHTLIVDVGVVLGLIAGAMSEKLTWGEALVGILLKLWPSTVQRRPAA